MTREQADHRLALNFAQHGYYHPSTHASPRSLQLIVRHLCHIHHLKGFVPASVGRFLKTALHWGSWISGSSRTRILRRGGWNQRYRSRNKYNKVLRCLAPYPHLHGTNIHTNMNPQNPRSDIHRMASASNPYPTNKRSIQFPRLKTTNPSSTAAATVTSIPPERISDGIYNG